MPRCLRDACRFATIVATVFLLSPAVAHAQQRIIRVMSDDGEPVAYANVTLAGERPVITNEKGEVAIAGAPRPSIVVDERLFGRQRGIGSGVYLTPEELELRNTTVASALLQGLNGVSLQRTATGRPVIMSAAGTCPMAVLVDGRRVCPDQGCGGGSAAPPPAPAGGSRRGRSAASMPSSNEGQFVQLDTLLSASEVAAIEVYPRGGSVPPSLPTVDSSCGLVAFWTGGRKTP